VELLIFDVDEPTNEAGERAAARVLLRPDRPDVIIGWNDLVAIGMMNEARSLGFKVPFDVAFAGIDNIPISRYVTPPLTTVDVCSQTTGEVVMKKIIAMIEEKPQPTDLTLEPALIIRESTQRQFT
jgi:LacI family transcriptional regulator